MRTRKTLVLLGITLALLTMGPAATAAEPTPDDSSPELLAYLDTLAPAQRDEFVRTMLPARTEVTQTLARLGAVSSAQMLDRASSVEMFDRAVTPLASTTCYSLRTTWAAYSAVGVRLYTWYHVGGWCLSGTTVRSASVLDAGGQTYAVGWRYEGVSRRDSRVINNTGRSYTQHRFVLGVGGWDVQTPLECARVIGTGTKGKSDKVCGVY